MFIFIFSIRFLFASNRGRLMDHWKSVHRELLATEQATPKRKRYPTLACNSALELNRGLACVFTVFTGYDFQATRIVMQACLPGCSILPSWREKSEIPALPVARRSIREAEISVADQILT